MRNETSEHENFNCGLPITVAEVEEQIAAGHSNASIIPWLETNDLFGPSEPDPQKSIAAAIKEFEQAGWHWNGRDLIKDGWFIWFRSQGTLSQPIIQWARR